MSNASTTLKVLAESGPLTPTELAARVGVSLSTTSRVISRLVRDGRVVRVEDPHDRRTYSLRLTRAGELAHEPESTGIWIAYHGDWSGMSVFADEISCLRHAVEHSMLVKFVEYGASLR